MVERDPATNTSKRALNHLTKDQVRQMFDYCVETGALIRLTSAGPIGKTGDRAGSLRGSGYRSIKISGRIYIEHRVIWLWWYGEWPDRQIDHMNNVRDDNRIENLRLASNQENQRNCGLRKDNKVGVKGVIKVGNRYRALIKAGGAQKHLGYFSTPLEAGLAYQAACRTLHGDFAHP
jgi:hypothetical protein